MLGRTAVLLDDYMPDAPAAHQPWSAGWPQTPREFEALLDYVQDRLVWYAYQRLGDLGEAEDIVQDVIVRAYADRDKRVNVLRVVPYLYRMVANACAERYRRNGARPPSLESIRLDGVPDQQGTVSEQIEAIEQLQWIHQLLNRLPAKQADVIRLRVLDELPLADVAATVGCSLSTAKSRLCYGLQKLRRMVPTLADAAQFVEGVKSMHIVANFRTVPHEHFDYIDLNAPLIPVHIWAESSDPPKWRVEKDGRCVVMDGASTTLLIRSDVGPFAARMPGSMAGMVGWLSPLLDIGKLFTREQELAARQGSQTSLDRKTGADGRPQTVLTVRARAQGDFGQSDYMKNSSVMESDNVRVYTFDAEVQRLEGLRVYVTTANGDVLVFETTEVEYDEPVAGYTFIPDIPDDATWIKDPGELPNMRDTSKMPPDAAAREFFEACAKSDWDGARAFAGTLVDNAQVREMFGGLKLISVGKPFKSGQYPGWFVPYEIRFRSGETRQHNLAIRNDNPKHLWTIDGGF